MNILLINHYAGSPQHGMEYRPFYLAREWARAGHGVTIVAASFSHVRSQNPILSHNWQDDNIEGVRFVWVKAPPYSENGSRRALNIFSFVGQLLLRRSFFKQNPPQLIIASSTYPLDIVPAARLARKVGARLVYEVHDLWPLTLIEIGGMSPSHPFIRLLQWAEDYGYRRADYVVSILPKAMEHMLAHGMTPEKFIYLPNGIDLADWEGEREGIPLQHQKVLSQLRQDHRFLIGYAGAHGLANALHTVVEAATRLKKEHISFVLVGNGPEKEKLISAAAQNGLDNIVFLPAISKSAIPTFLAEMDALYIGLKNEPLFRFGISPNKLMDYLMSAKPIIQAIDAGNDLVAESQSGISIPPENPEALAEAALFLYRLPQAKKIEMGMRGKAYVLEYHDYRILAQKFLASVFPNDENSPVV